MESRKDNLFKVIVEEYIKTANPVGSSFIAEKYFPEFSSATIRNDMAELENEGLLHQPHTSAGRVPTLEGFKKYIRNLEKEEKLSDKDEDNIDELDLSNNRENIKQLAKKLAELSNDAVIVGFGPFDVYYTGLSNLFSQPEFIDNELVHSMSQVIDDLDNVMERYFLTAGDGSEVVMGDDNPFGDSCSAIVSKMAFEDGEIIVAILGPMRMDYSRNLSLVDYIQKKLNLNNDNNK